jgi:hypothetical protein
MKLIYLGREKRNRRLTIPSRKYRKTSAASFHPLSHLVIGFDSGIKETANRFHEPSKSTNQLDHTTAQDSAKSPNSICHVQRQVAPSLAGRVAVHQPDPARLRALPRPIPSHVPATGSPEPCGAGCPSVCRPTICWGSTGRNTTSTRPGSGRTFTASGDRADGGTTTCTRWRSRSRWERGC